jgi:hypothetical protein
MARMVDTEIPRLKPAMAAKEIAHLDRLLSGAKTYVEFGCGGSTLHAVRAGIKKIWSVESDRRWIRKLRLHPEIKAAEDEGRLTFVRARIGATGRYGYPVLEKLRFIWPVHLFKWPRYYETVWEHEGTADADFFLIDGRFRVACALMVALKCRPDAIVAVHDFAKRPHYAELLKFYDRVALVRNMQVLRVKPNLDRAAVRAALRRARYNPA